MTSPLVPFKGEHESAQPNDDGTYLETNRRGNLRDLHSAAVRELESALGQHGSKLDEALRTNLSNYLANPRGDEKEGQSQVVTRTTFEEVEWLVPPMMDMFMSGPEVCRFLPQGPEGEEEADQRTDAANYVFTRQNDGFTYLMTGIKDAAISKNGIGKVTFDQSAKTTLEEYEGKTAEELIFLEEDPDFEFEEATARVVEIPGVGPVEVFDVRGRRTEINGRVVLDNIPPEEFLINRDARSIDEDDPTLRFVGHRTRTTESELIGMGYAPDRVKSIPSSHSTYSNDQDAIVRASEDDAFALSLADRQDSERTVYVIEAYIKYDLSGDGISEWHKIVMGGDYGQALVYHEETDGHPFTSLTLIPITHRFYGLGLADITDDLQAVDTTLWRQYLNSLYLANNPRHVVLSQGRGEAATPMANLNQLANNIPGGWVEEYQPGAIRELETKDAAEHVLPAIELHKDMRQKRTGVSPEAMGINPDSISKHVLGTVVQQSAAAQRITMYARIAAETFVRRTFQLIDKCLLQNQTQVMHIRLRDEWIPVDPSTWKTRLDAEVSVGLGHGSKLERSNNAMSILAVQKEAIEGGFRGITEENVFNAIDELVTASGFKNASKFVTDPATMGEPPPEKPSPEELAIEAQLEVDAAKLRLEEQKLALETRKAEWSHEEKMAELGLKEFDMKAGLEGATPTTGAN